MSLRRTVQLALAVVVATFALSLTSAAGAVENPDYTAPPRETRSTVPEPVRRTSTVATPARSTLAITGSDAAQLAVVGGLLLAGGAATLAVRRRSVA